jgi:hypothetical protein
MKKRIVTIFILLVVAFVGGGYYYFSGREYVFRFSENQIREKLSTKLPLTKAYLLIFEVTLDNPRVSLLDKSKRVNAGLDVVLNVRIGNEPRPLGGTIDASGEIKYVQATGEFFLTDPVIERLAVQGIPDAYAGKVSSALTKAVAAYYADHPIYSLRATDAKHAAARLVLKNVVVENHELVVTLGL